MAFSEDDINYAEGTLIRIEDVMDRLKKAVDHIEYGRPNLKEDLDFIDSFLKFISKNASTQVEDELVDNLEYCKEVCQILDNIYNDTLEYFEEKTSGLLQELRKRYEETKRLIDK